MKIEFGGNILVNMAKYDHYAKFLHPALLRVKDNESAVLELQLNAHLISRKKEPHLYLEESRAYTSIVFVTTEGDVSVEQFDEDFKRKVHAEKFHYRYANLCEILTYCDIKTSWRKDTFLVPGTFYQDENLYRYAIKCSVGKMPMLDPKILIEIKPWTPKTKLGPGKKIPMVRSELLGT